MEVIRRSNGRITFYIELNCCGGIGRRRGSEAPAQLYPALIPMFSTTGLFDNDLSDDHRHQSLFSPHLFSSSTDPFIRSGGGPLDNSNPDPLISSIASPLELEQIQQARECLETSASYMQDIESFFRDLSSKTTPSSTTLTSTSSSQPPTPISAVNTLNSCIVNFDALDLDNFYFDSSTNLLNTASMIDPSIFNIKSYVSSDEDGDNDESSDVEPSVFNLYNWDEPYESTISSRSLRSTRAKKGSSSALSPSNSTSSTASASNNPKPPKFYSRSGQVADPRRGPCHNCHTTLTCYWRKLKGEYHCNACTLYYKRNKCHRSGDDLGDKPIKRRNRKSKYSPE